MTTLLHLFQFVFSAIAGLLLFVGCGVSIVSPVVAPILVFLILLIPFLRTRYWFIPFVAIAHAFLILLYMVSFANYQNTMDRSAHTAFLWCLLPAITGCIVILIYKYYSKSFAQPPDILQAFFGGILATYIGTALFVLAVLAINQFPKYPRITSLLATMNVDRFVDISATLIILGNFIAPIVSGVVAVVLLIFLFNPKERTDSAI